MNYIRLRKNNLCVENLQLQRIVKKYKTPFYCYSLKQLKSNFQNIDSAFEKVKPLICFSVKSNSNINLLRELRKMGSGADVVSIGELLKAIKAGINNKKIVFSGVGKTKEEIEIAIKKRVLLINVESENELNLINKIAKKKSIKVPVGIRLNPNVTGKTHKKISTGGKNEKFGLVYSDFINLCRKIKKMNNIDLQGLSVHIGSQITSVEPFKKVLGVINKIIKKTKINFKFIDLGGGMGISYSKNEKPIWITEFAVRDPDATTIENNQYSPEQVLEFMEAVLPELEEMEFVHRYSWFSTSTSNENYAKTATSVLIDDDNQITPLGEFYANFTED